MIASNALQTKLEQRQALLCDFASQKWIVDSAAALYWPLKDLLVVSDLHFEKASFLGMHGNPLPHYDSLNTLERLSLLLEQYTPHTVICLGDSFHDASAWLRLSDSERGIIQTMTESVTRWVWVLGNHDPVMPDELGGESLVDITLDDITFTHEPLDKQNVTYQVIGHFHPKMSKSVARHKMTGRCFIHNHNCLIMPAFGTYTGGLSIEDDAFKPLLSARLAAKYLLYQSKVFSL